MPTRPRLTAPTTPTTTSSATTSSAAAPSAATVVEPVPRGLQRVLRCAVLEHARHERRRVFPPAVHAGLPGRVTATWVIDPATDPLDHALRVDVVEAMLRRVRRPGPGSLVWLTRPPGPPLLEVDLAWLGAARTAGAELGMWLPMVVVTRRGWHDPQSGVGRRWERVRPGRETPPRP